MSNEYITCISCNSQLKRNISNDNFDCFCPICGSAIHITGSQCLPSVPPTPIIPDTSRLRSDLKLHIEYERWRYAHRTSCEIADITDDDKDWTIVLECAYFDWIGRGALGPAYVNLYYLLKKPEPFIRKRDFYLDEMYKLKQTLGVKNFQKEQVYDYMCSHCPENMDLSKYAGVFCYYAILMSKVGKDYGELKTSPKVIPHIKAFAKYYGIVIPKNIRGMME